MKLRQFLGRHAEKSLGKKTWSAVDLTKSIAREDPGDPAFQATGRGPGSGPEATPYNVTKLLLAALADVPHPDAPKAVFGLYTVQAEGNDSGKGSIIGDSTDLAISDEVKTCRLTGMLMFGEAVKALLADPVLAERVQRIEVRRGLNDATIHWRAGDALHRTRFVSDYDRARADEEDQQGHFRAVSSIGGAMLRELASDLVGG